jgi:hypothetical protein
VRPDLAGEGVVTPCGFRHQDGEAGGSG